MKFGARRQPEEHDNSQERWLVSYADFITLMFAFFVILYATSERDLDKVKKFQQSVDKYLIKAGAFGETGAKIEQGEKNFAVVEPPIQTFRPQKPDDTKLMDAIQNDFEAQLSEAERKKYLLDLSPDVNGIRITLAGSSIFSGDTAKFTATAVPFIDHVSEILKTQKKRVMIEGHVKAGEKGSFTSTWDLASARAVSFLRYMHKKVDYPLHDLAASTFGDTRPMQADAKKVNGANDRLELVVYYNDSDF